MKQSSCKPCDMQTYQTQLEQEAPYNAVAGNITQHNTTQRNITSHHYHIASHHVTSHCPYVVQSRTTAVSAQPNKRHQGTGMEGTLSCTRAITHLQVDCRGCSMSQQQHHEEEWVWSLEDVPLVRQNDHASACRAHTMSAHHYCPQGHCLPHLLPQ